MRFRGITQEDLRKAIGRKSQSYISDRLNDKNEWGLDSEDRNRLLKGMAERIEYEKTERGTGIEPRIRATLRI